MDTDTDIKRTRKVERIKIKKKIICTDAIFRFKKAFSVNLAS